MSNLTVYKASAGSGKTFTLAAQYIASLLKNDPNMYRHILAVTFTNKATAEMKERILQRLWDLAHLPDNIRKEDNDFYCKIAELLPELSLGTIRQRADNALRSLTHDYDHFYIQTIDSFFQSLLSNLAHEMGLAAGFKVDLDDKEAIRKGVERLMGKIDSDEDLKKWILNYIRERIEDNKRWDITAELNTLAQELTKEQFMQHEAELCSKLNDSEYLGKYRTQLSAQQENLSKIIQDAAKTFDDCIVSQNPKGYAVFNRGNSVLGSYIRKLMKGDFSEPSETMSNWIDTEESTEEKWLTTANRNKQDMVELAENYKKKVGIVEDCRKEGVRTINSCSLSLRHINPLRLLNAIGHEVNAINNENNRFMLAKTPQLFQQLVKKEDASFIFEKAGLLFNEIMIDEFQDTSSLQWENFKKLLIENLASGNGCLLVGDVKQSIYRFRGGDWSILSKIKDEFPNNEPCIMNLDQNFRSTENIISFNNAFFPEAAKILDNIENANAIASITGIYDDVQQKINHKSGGTVRIKLYVADKAKTKDNNLSVVTDDDLCDDAQDSSENEDTLMEEDMAQQILELRKKGTSFNDIAILVRYNNDAKVILSYFSEKHPEIPLISDEAFLLAASPAVELIIHALRYLNDNKDTIALAYVTHCYRNNVLLENREWTDLCINNQTYLPAGFREEEAQNELRNMPLYQLCEKLIDIFQLTRCKGASPYLFAFLDQVLVFLEDNASDIAAFLQVWNEVLYRKAVPAGEVEGVRILTIHKSKGLAFHTVFLPYCHWNIERDQMNDLLWCSTQEQQPYCQLPVLPIPLYASKTVKNSIYEGQYKEEHKQRRIDNLNLLYVAFTRAQRNLYIWAEARENEKPSKDLPKEPNIGDLILASLKKMNNDPNLSYDESLDVWHYAVEESQTTNRKETTPLPPNPLDIHAEKIELLNLYQTKNNVEYMQSNRAKEFLADAADEEENPSEQVQKTYISQGKLLHRLFAAIRTADDIDSAIREFEQQGCIAQGKQAEQLRDFIHKRLTHPQIAEWFDGSWQLFNECNILVRDKEGKLHIQRPDRVMVSGNEAIVVDFKFGKPKPEYNDQVKRYCHLLQQMNYQPVSGYLWYVYSGNIEKVL